MMRDYADQVNLHARLWALKSRLLARKDYVLLASNQSVPPHDGDEPAGESIFPRQIAHIISLVEAAPIYKPLFLAFFRQYEAQNIKLLIAEHFGLKTLEQWYDISPYEVASQNKLRDAGTLQDLALLLKGTYLEDVFEDITSYEKMETRADLCIARNWQEASASFSRQAKLDYQQLMCRRTAVVTALISLRLRKTYQWEEEKIHAYLTPFFDTTVVGGGTQMKVVKSALNRFLESARSVGAPEPSPVEIERYLAQYDYDWISSAFHRDFFSISCVVAYLWLVACQIRNLLKINDGRRFGFTPDQIMDRIVCCA